MVINSVYVTKHGFAGGQADGCSVVCGGVRNTKSPVFVSIRNVVTQEVNCAY